MAANDDTIRGLRAALAAAVDRGDDALVDAALTPLIRLAQGGDRPALRLILAHINDQRIAHRSARKITLNDADVDEVAQHTLIAVAEQIDRFEHRGSFTGWVAVTASNKAKQLVRWKTSGVNEVAAAPKQRGAGSVTRFSSLVADEELVERALSQLSPRQREILELREVYGYSYEEIADRFAIPRNTVGTHLHRARARLVDVLLSTHPDATRAGE